MSFFESRNQGGLGFRVFMYYDSVYLSIYLSVYKNNNHYYYS